MCASFLSGKIWQKLWELSKNTFMEQKSSKTRDKRKKQVKNVNGTNIGREFSAPRNWNSKFWRSKGS